MERRKTGTHKNQERMSDETRIKDNIRRGCSPVCAEGKIAEGIFFPCICIIYVFVQGLPRQLFRHKALWQISRHMPLNSGAAAILAASVKLSPPQL
jgi:hypothetical protein